jgi:DNA mismatch endonuclease Vsr
MDTLTVAGRSERMARIRSKDTKPELRVRKLLHRLGYRFRLHRKDLPGSPDVVFPTRRKAIFVHGCFWHAHEACTVANRPKSRRTFWDSKFERNKLRDAANQKALKKKGWKVYTVWECETFSERPLSLRLSKFLGPARTTSPMKRDPNGRK